MKVEAIPLTDFVHGHIHAKEGKVIVPYIDESLARELEQNGLVRIKMSPQPMTSAARTDDTMTKNGAAEAGKAQDDGAGRPSSVSPAAQALPPQTPPLFKTGSGRHRRSDT